MRHIPNSITLLNLFLGCIAVVLALSGELATSAILILVCSLLDFLDGAMARLLKAWSPLGVQLDSLADLVSFGFAPAAIFFFYLQEAVQQQALSGIFVLLPWLAFLITVFSGLRLAIFNTDQRQHHTFIGLPTPANALFFAALPLSMRFSGGLLHLDGLIRSMTGNVYLMVGITFLFSYLLVSPFRMFSFKIQSASVKDNIIPLVFLAVSLIFLLLFHLQALFPIMLFYILFSLFSLRGGYRHDTSPDHMNQQ